MIQVKNTFPRNQIATIENGIVKKRQHRVRIGKTQFRSICRKRTSTPQEQNPIPYIPQLHPFILVLMARDSKDCIRVQVVFIGECNVVFVDDEIGSYMKDGEFVEVKHVGIMIRSEN
jgi:hypothetical protein